uniref:Uncharacterized protein n=1 Tax=Anguilla anguilla TaxID=7936 RepID=A0A0E9WMR3_ANGAN
MWEWESWNKRPSFRLPPSHHNLCETIDVSTLHSSETIRFTSGH